jgi:hypothetical protein
MRSVVAENIYARTEKKFRLRRTVIVFVHGIQCMYNEHAVKCRAVAGVSSAETNQMYSFLCHLSHCDESTASSFLSVTIFRHVLCEKYDPEYKFLA